jgi:signal transduction histidine kinase
VSGAPGLTLADLRAVDLFDDLDDEGLAEWVAVAQLRRLAPGELVVEQGRRAAGLSLLLDGVIRTTFIEGGRAEAAGRHVAPTWIGAIPVLTRSPVPIRLEAETACRVATVPADDARRLIVAQPAVHDRVMAQVGPVMSRVSAIEQSRERLAALGTMAAGLAHELNNPAAAAQRAAAEIVEALDAVNGTLRRFVESGVEREQAEQLLALHAEALAGAERRGALDALDAADAEDDLRDGLEARGVPSAWRLAGPLAAAGVDEDWVERVCALAGPATDAALSWVAASLTARDLAGELQESTRRMSDLVGAIKSYSYMDRGERVEVDLHEGLETTLVVLGHRLRAAGIDLVRDYDRTLPRVTVHGSELNQVWTNLIDNAIQAVGDGGRITIATRRDGPCARVDVGDDGPGIPPELSERIFDSFFTTKDVGEGTGLGLATARRIVVDRHGGSLTVDSRPGETVFHVRIPL